MRAFRALWGIALVAALLVPAPPAAAATPTLHIAPQQRGASAELQLAGLTPNAAYRLTSDYETFPDGAVVHASATGQVVTTAELKAAVPLTVTTVHIGVGATTFAVPVAAPSTDFAPCPARASALGSLRGFPPGTYDLDSPVVQLNTPDVTVSKADSTFDVSVPADAPARFPITVSPHDSGTPKIVLQVALRRAGVGFTGVNEPASTGWGDCFHPGATVRFSAASANVTTPASVVADANGVITFPVRVVAGATQLPATFDADDGRGSAGRAAALVGATTELAGTYLPQFVSPHLDYAVGTYDCLPAVYHLVRTDGAVRYDVAWLGRGTHRPTLPCAVLLRADGNLTVFSGSQLLWQNGARGGTQISLDDSGQLVERAVNGVVVWSSRTGLHPLSERGLGTGAVLLAGQSLHGGPATLYLQGNGDLVLFRGRVAVWSSHTAGTRANRLVMQRTGALDLLLPSGARVWSTYTTGRGNHMSILGRGQLVVFAPGGHSLWRS